MRAGEYLACCEDSLGGLGPSQAPGLHRQADCDADPWTPAHARAPVASLLRAEPSSLPLPDQRAAGAEPVAGPGARLQVLAPDAAGLAAFARKLLGAADGSPRAEGRPEWRWGL